MKKFNITIEETLSKTFTVIAEDAESALALSEEKYKTGEFVIDGDVQVTEVKASCHDLEADTVSDYINF